SPWWCCWRSRSRRSRSAAGTGRGPRIDADRATDPFSGRNSERFRSLTAGFPQEILRFVFNNDAVDGRRHLRVLVVDDEPNIVDVVSMALRHHGFDVDAAETGAGALARVREARPDVMVLDVMLPDMD